MVGVKTKQIACICLIALASFSVHAEEKLTKEQIRLKLDELNAACEQARQKKLAPLRAQYIEECVSKQRKDRHDCQRFYADYGARSGKRPPLFLDLPECVEAFEFQKAHKER